MIRKNEERIIDRKEAMKEGPGHVLLKSIASSEELYNKVKMYSQLTLETGCGIGKHTHTKESEIIIITKGEADYLDDDKEYKLHEGDVAICFQDHAHSICNNSKENLEFVALIIYE